MTSSRKQEGNSQSGRKFLQIIRLIRVGSRIWKECLQPNNKKAKNKIETWAKDLNRPFSKEDKHMASKYRKRCSTSSVSREKQIKTTVRSRLTCTRMARFTMPEDKCWENVHQRSVKWCSPFGKQSHSSSKC